ncbi:MAG: formylglycine-generating enzyme family protein [Pseudomonadales bacterium]
MHNSQSLTIFTLARCVRTVLICALLFVAAACASSRSVQTSPGEEADLNRLVQLSHTDERDQWFPAVEKLGQAAEADDQARGEIWAWARVNTLGMKFFQVKPGTFIMGPDTHRIFNVQAAHRVKLSKSYFISVTEVTNAQFQQLLPDFQPDETYSPDADSPAVNVSWNQADQFCKLLSEKEGTVYRLPTEAEWEYACRAGSTSRFCFGDNVAKLPEYGWCDESRGRASGVAMLKPNEWGIYDAHGNVFEWVSDRFSNSYYAACAAEGIVEDPQGPRSVWSHVLRSGPRASGNPAACTSTARFPRPFLDRVPFDRDPVRMSQLIGFRVVRESGK